MCTGGFNRVLCSATEIQNQPTLIEQSIYSIEVVDALDINNDTVHRCAACE